MQMLFIALALTLAYAEVTIPPEDAAIQLVLQNWKDLSSNEELPAAIRFAATKRYYSTAKDFLSKDDPADQALLWDSLALLRTFVYRTDAGALINFEAAEAYEDAVKQIHISKLEELQTKIATELLSTFLQAFVDQIDDDDNKTLSDTPTDDGIPPHLIPPSDEE